LQIYLILEINGQKTYNTLISDADTPALQQENAAKSLKLASMLFPDEEWILNEPSIYVARNRLSEAFKEPDKWEREMSQVRILTSNAPIPPPISTNR
jgi:hypothetical protein